MWTLRHPTHHRLQIHRQSLKKHPPCETLKDSPKNRYRRTWNSSHAYKAVKVYRQPSFPLRDRNREAQNRDTEEAAFDAFMKEIDEVLESDDSDDETVRGAPSHYPEISAERMQSLWKQARQEDSDQ